MLKLLGLAERVWELFIALLVAGLLVVVASQVVDRYVIDLWTDSPEEWIKIGLVWLTFVGFALAMRHGTDIRVDLVEHFLPRKLVTAVNTVFDTLLLVLIGVLCFKTWQLWDVSRDQAIVGTSVSVATPTAGLLVGLVLMLIVVAVRLVLRLMHRDNVDAHDPTKQFN
jgi:TRAP-type C4-dicarboxylate transport system permease small subunit